MVSIWNPMIYLVERPQVVILLLFVVLWEMSRSIKDLQIGSWWYLILHNKIYKLFSKKKIYSNNILHAILSNQNQTIWRPRLISARLEARHNNLNMSIQRFRVREEASEIKENYKMVICFKTINYQALIIQNVSIKL